GGGDLGPRLAPLAVGDQLVDLGLDRAGGRREAHGDGRRGGGLLRGLVFRLRLRKLVLRNFGDRSRRGLGRRRRLFRRRRDRRRGGGRRGLGLVPEEREVGDGRREGDGDQDGGKLRRFPKIGRGQHGFPSLNLSAPIMTPNRKLSRTNHNL